MKKKNEISLLVGKKIRCLRQDRGLTMEQLAFEVGIEYTQLSRIERGRINTSVFQLFLISKALDIGFSEITNDLTDVLVWFFGRIILPPLLYDKYDILFAFNLI